MSSTHSVQGPSSNAAAEARRVAYTRPPTPPADNELRSQDNGEAARIAAERNEEASGRAAKQRQGERQADLELPGKTGRNLDFLA